MTWLGKVFRRRVCIRSGRSSFSRGFAWVYGLGLSMNSSGARRVAGVCGLDGTFYCKTRSV